MPVCQTVQVPQDCETPVQLVPGPAFAFRYAYARSADTRAAGDPGQDYLIFCHDNQAFVFALCDGVSQSFYGDLAARLLGDALLDWLINALPASPDDHTIIRDALTVHLNSLTDKATDQVRRHPLPLDIPPMLRVVLEEKREMGSESTFVCGRIDLPGPQFPQGRVVLAWMGDSRLRLWGPAGELGTELGDQFKTEQRWSSLQGLVGDELHLFVRPLDQDGRRSILRLMVYSDGLFSLDEHSYSLSNLFVQDLIDRAGETATSDDISFLQVWLEPVPAQVESTPLLAPKWLHVRVRNGCLRAIWHSVSEATYYQIEVRADKMSEISPTDARYWTSLPLDPGQYSVRVRAMQNDNLGHWSEAREVEVPSPVSAILLPAPSVPETAPSVLPPPVRPVPTRRLSQTTWIAVGVGVLIVVSLIMLSSVLAFPENGPLHGLLFGATSTSTSTPTATFTPTTVRRATATITVTPIISTSTTTRTPTVTRTVAPTVSLTSTPSSTHTVTRISPISTLARATSQASQQAPAPKGSPAMTGSPGP